MINQPARGSPRRLDNQGALTTPRLPAKPTAV
jgi:hypothetical protein